MRVLYPCVVPVRYVALYAMQSGHYIPSPEWLKKYAKMCHEEAQGLWDIMHTPKATTIDETDKIFFERTSGSRKRVRYFVAAPLSSIPADHEGIHDRAVPVPSAVLTPERSDNASTEKLRSSEGGRSTGMALIDMLRERGEQPSRDRIPLTENFEPLPEEPTPQYFIDRGGSEPTQFICPDTLEEILFVVKGERQNRLDIIQAQHFERTPRNAYAASASSGDADGQRRTELGSSSSSRHTSLEDYGF